MAAVLSDAQRAAGHDSTATCGRLSPHSGPNPSLLQSTLAAGLDQFMIREKGFDAPVSLVRDTLRWNLNAALGVQTLFISII